MRVLVALGGNALLKRGEPMTAEVQRANVRVAAAALAPVAAQHQLVISHGNGPQVGLLALQASRLHRGRGVPARRPRRPDRGDDRLPDRAGARQPAPGRGAAGDAPDDDRGRRRRPGVRRPDQVRRARSTTTTRPTALAAEKGWVFKRDGDHLRRVVPSPAPKRIFEIRPIRWLLEHGRRRDLRRRRRHPHDVGAGRGAHARRHRGGDRQGPRQRAARPGGRRRPVRDGDRRRRRVRGLGHAGAAQARPRSRPTSCAARHVRRRVDGPEGRGRGPVRRGTGRRAAIGALADIEQIVDGHGRHQRGRRAATERREEDER